jgi:hypothetical protein
MSNLTAATEDRNFLISKLTTQIERLSKKKERRIAKIEKINERLATKRESINNAGDATEVISQKFEKKNNRDKELFEKGLERRTNRLTTYEKRLTDLTTRIDNYKIALQAWTNKKNESNRLKAEKRATKIKAVSVNSILEYIDKRELYISVLEKRNSQADALVIEKQNYIEKIKQEIENLKNKPKTKIKLVKEAAKDKQPEPMTDSTPEPAKETESETTTDKAEEVKAEEVKAEDATEEKKTNKKSSPQAKKNDKPATKTQIKK